MDHLRLMYHRMSQVKGTNKKYSASSVRSIFYIPILKTCGPAPDYDG